MTYPAIPILLVAILLIYLLYLLFYKKDIPKFKQVGSIGVFFTLIWVVIYYFLFR